MRRKTIWIFHIRFKSAWLFYILGLVLLVSVFSGYWPTVKTWSEWNEPLTGLVVVVDAGHGGPDGGAVSRSGLSEKNVNLNIAIMLRDYLQEAGAIVYMTRESDTDLADDGPLKARKTQDLHRRAQLVKDKKANLLISIHLNSIASSRWSGAQTFYYPKLEESKRLAVLIQDELRENLENTDRLARTVQTPYLMKTAEIPAALVEAGFLSNPEEARLLGTEAYQSKIGASIYRGILRWTSGEKLGSAPMN